VITTLNTSTRDSALLHLLAVEGSIAWASVPASTSGAGCLVEQP
jgi:hypothetical protein